ncbi:MAG TPA: hypothetical protein VGB25_10950 [Candidatus Binatia bacterium]
MKNGWPTITDKTLLLGFGFVLFLAVIPPGAGGYPVDMDKLPHQGRNSYGCLVCHLNPAGGELTSFGGDYMINDFHYDASIKQKDSDGDGFSNESDLTARPASHPGDPASHPFQPPGRLAWAGTLAAVLVLLAGGFSLVIRNSKPHP